MYFGVNLVSLSLGCFLNNGTWARLSTLSIWPDMASAGDCCCAGCRCKLIWRILSVKNNGDITDNARSNSNVVQDRRPRQAKGRLHGRERREECRLVEDDSPPPPGLNAWCMTNNSVPFFSLSRNESVSERRHNSVGSLWFKTINKEKWFEIKNNLSCLHGWHGHLLIRVFFTLLHSTTKLSGKLIRKLWPVW